LPGGSGQLFQLKEKRVSYPRSPHGGTEKIRPGRSPATLPVLQALSPLSRESGLFKVKFSDGSSLIFSADYLEEEVKPGSWEEGRELSVKEEDALKFAASCHRVEKAALKLIARAEQNSLGLKAKLGRKGFSGEAVKTVISRLLDRGLLNDERFAELWIHSRLALKRARSPRWLLVSLGKRGIDRGSSFKALKKALDPETEYTLLLKYLAKLDLPGNEQVLRAKLRNEGFSSSVLDRYNNSL
jgi:regulatory protein